MSDSLNKYCSEAKDLKDVKDAMNKIQKLRAQMKYTLLGQYERGLRLHCIAKIGEKAFNEQMIRK